MSEKFYKVSKYFNDCYCGRRPRVNSVIVKFAAEMAKFDIGTGAAHMTCEFCKRKVFYRIDTWWGGKFANKDTIFEDSARKIKLKMCDVRDVTNELLESQYNNVKLEAQTQRKKCNDAEFRLKELTNILGKTRRKRKMDKFRGNADVSVTYGGYSICNYRKDITKLEVINELCKDASEQDKDLIKAKIKMNPADSIFSTQERM